MYEEEEEDYLNDIISLNYFHIKTEEPVIDLSTSTDDEAEDDKSLVFVPRSSYGNRCFVLPITFFDISRNVEFLKKCRPLSVKVVDCGKHPSYYENILRPKKSVCDVTYPELSKLLKSKKEAPKENNAKDVAIPVNEIIHSKVNEVVTDSEESKTEIIKRKRQTASGCPSHKETDRVDTEGRSNNHVLPNVEYEKRQAVRCNNLTKVDLQRNKGLVGLVITKKDVENTANCDKSDTVAKKTNNVKVNHKQSVKDVGKALNKLEKEKLVIGPIDSKVNDALVKNSSNAKESIMEAKESSEGVDDKDKEEHNNEDSPTRCSIKITCPKVFEKAIQLKKSNNIKPPKAKSELNMKPVTEEITTKDQTIPKLSLKRKKSDIKEFYIINPAKDKSIIQPAKEKSIIHPAKEKSMINPVKEKSVVNPVKEKSVINPVNEKSMINPVKEKSMINPAKEKTIINLAKEKSMIDLAKEKSYSDSLNKKPKCSEESQKQQKIRNETQDQPTESVSKIVSCIKDTSMRSTLVPSSQSFKRVDQKLVTVQTPKVAKGMHMKLNRNENDPKNGTANKVQSKPIRLQCPKDLFNTKYESNSDCQKSDKQVIKSKNQVNCLNPTYTGATNSGNRCIENSYNLALHIGPKNKPQINTSNENERPNQCVAEKNFLIVQKIPPARFKSTIKNIEKKIHNKPISYQAKSDVGGLKPTELPTSLTKGQIGDVSQIEKNTLNKGVPVQYLLNNQPNADIPNQNALNVSRSKSEIYSHSLCSTYKSVKSSDPNDTSDNSALPSHFNGPKNIAILQNTTGNENQLSNQVMAARDTNFAFMKSTPPMNYRELDNGVSRLQENHKGNMPQTILNTPTGPTSFANDYTTLERPIYSKPPMHKAIILKGTSARLPNSMHQNYGSPIPTVVNHNVYHPRPPLIRPLRFVSPWPPPNTNVASLPQVNLRYNGVPNCRMPFFNTNMSGHPMYPEIWRPQMNENYRNYFMRPPPPPPTAPVPNNINTTALPTEPPAPIGTVIGSNAEGQLIKKITIAAVPSSRTPVVNDKDKMLAELNSAVEELEAASSKLEDLKINVQPPAPVKVDSPKTDKPLCSRPCPLSKKKYSLQHTNVEEKAKLVLAKEPVKSYSPPILPIPSYQQAYEILVKNEQKMADILKKMECINANKEVNIQPAKKRMEKDSKKKQVVDKPMKNKFEQTTKNKQADCKPMKRKLPASEKRKDEKVKKISLDEYKNKLANNNVSISEGSRSKCKKRKKLKGLAVDNSLDLGYDSDATLVL